jgi:hypothetical protein
MGEMERAGDHRRLAFARRAPDALPDVEIPSRKPTMRTPAGGVSRVRASLRSRGDRSGNQVAKRRAETRLDPAEAAEAENVALAGRDLALSRLLSARTQAHNPLVPGSNPGGPIEKNPARGRAETAPLRGADGSPCVTTARTVHIHPGARLGASASATRRSAI